MSTPEQNRQRRHRVAQAQGRTIRPRQATGIDTADKAAYRREYKRISRHKAGAVLRIQIQAETRAKREAAAARGALRLAIAGLHDAHVKRYVYVLSCRAKYAKRYAANPCAERERTSKSKQELRDFYVIQNIKLMGIPANAITPSLIAIKREAMEYRRLGCTIKTTVKNHLKEANEAITKHP